MNIIGLKKIGLFIGDIIVLYIALFITLLLRYGHALTSDLFFQHIPPFTLLFVIWLVVFFINNLYSVQSVSNNYRFYSALIQNLAVNALIGFTFFYLAPASFTSLRPLRVLILLLVIFGILFPTWRRLFYYLTSSRSLANHFLLVGLNAESLELLEILQKNPQLGYQPTLIIDAGDMQLPDSLSHLVRLKELAGLSETIRKYSIDTVVTVDNPQRSPEITQYLFETLHLGIKYYNFPVFFEKITGKIPVGSLEKNWFFENLLEGNKKMYEFSKRIIDVIAAVFFGLLSVPLIPFIYMAIKFTSPGPILFRQIRTGKGGKNFLAMKFRTMVDNAEKNGPQWATKNDNRITRIGRFLRKTRLDEIPQFLNILKGDMSFVGPRPERPEFVNLLTQEIPFYKERLLVKPGLTGWAQINYKYGDSLEDTMVKLQYDLYYIKNRSVTLDLSVILKTIHTVFDASLGQ